MGRVKGGEKDKKEKGVFYSTISQRPFWHCFQNLPNLFRHLSKIFMNWQPFARKMPDCARERRMYQLFRISRKSETSAHADTISHASNSLVKSATKSFLMDAILFSSALASALAFATSFFSPFFFNYKYEKPRHGPGSPYVRLNGLIPNICFLIAVKIIAVTEPVFFQFPQQLVVFF